MNQDLSGCTQGQIKALVDPRHLEMFCGAKLFFEESIAFILTFVSPISLIFDVGRPLFLVRPLALCLVCLMVNPALAVLAVHSYWWYIAEKNFVSNKAKLCKVIF
jgi:hypothetical protein